MSVLLTLAGAALVALVLREVFHTIFHPSGRGELSMLVFRSVWALTGKLGRRARGLSGPLSMVLVIALWATGLVVGWALVYWPALPGGFSFAAPLRAGAHGGLVDALYFSGVTQATLGFGDITPRDGVLRLLAPLQATIGFALFTAGVTWVLSVYPALQRQRAAASVARSIREGNRGFDETTAGLPPAALVRQTERLAELLAAVRVDLMQYPSIFYFAAPTVDVALSEALPYVASLARQDGAAYELRPAAAELASALDLLLTGVGDQFLGMSDADTADVLTAFRRHTGPLPGDGA